MPSSSAASQPTTAIARSPPEPAPVEGPPAATSRSAHITGTVLMNLRPESSDGGLRGFPAWIDFDADGSRYQTDLEQSDRTGAASAISAPRRRSGLPADPWVCRHSAGDAWPGRI